MTDPAEASTTAVDERQAQPRLVGLLREALPGEEVATEYRVDASPHYLADTAISRARLVIELKHRRDPYALRQAEDQMARLASVGWTCLLVFSNDLKAAVREVLQQAHLILRGQS